jgi:hypothetical protein
VEKFIPAGSFLKSKIAEEARHKAGIQLPLAIATCPVGITKTFSDSAYRNKI